MSPADLSRSRAAAVVSRRTRLARLPASGLASMAMTLSPLQVASVWPSISVVVVLPTPPFRLTKATRRCPVVAGVRTRAITWRWLRSDAEGPRFNRPPLIRYSTRRGPFCGGDDLGGEGSGPDFGAAAAHTPLGSSSGVVAGSAVIRHPTGWAPRRSRLRLAGYGLDRVLRSQRQSGWRPSSR